MKKFIICGNYGASNLGDEAILDGIIDSIREDEPDAEITAMSANPVETSHLHQIQSIPFVPSGFRSFLRAWQGDLRKTYNAVKSADIFVLGGGGLFTDEKLKAVIIWYIQAKFALQLGKSLFCIGQSVGPLRTKLGRFLTRKIFKKAALITVRDGLSAKVLNTLGIQNVKVLPDPAFRLSCKVLSLRERKSFVVISIRPWLIKEQNTQYLVLAQFIDWIYEKYGFTVKLVPFQKLQDNDEVVFKKISQHLKNPEIAEIIPYDPDYRKALETISHAHAVVGMRLHSLIFAALTQTPFLALSYSQKVDGVVKELGMEKFLLEWKNFSLEMLQEKFKKLQKDAEEVSTQFGETIVRFEKKRNKF